MNKTQAKAFYNSSIGQISWWLASPKPSDAGDTHMSGEKNDQIEAMGDKAESVGIICTQLYDLERVYKEYFTELDKELERSQKEKGGKTHMNRKAGKSNFLQSLKPMSPELLKRNLSKYYSKQHVEFKTAMKKSGGNYLRIDDYLLKGRFDKLEEVYILKNVSLDQMKDMAGKLNQFAFLWAGEETMRTLNIKNVDGEGPEDVIEKELLTFHIYTANPKNLKNYVSERYWKDVFGQEEVQSDDKRISSKKSKVEDDSDLPISDDELYGDFDPSDDKRGQKRGESEDDHPYVNDDDFLDADIDDEEILPIIPDDDDDDDDDEIIPDEDDEEIIPTTSESVNWTKNSIESTLSSIINENVSLFEAKSSVATDFFKFMKGFKTAVEDDSISEYKLEHQYELKDKLKTALKDEDVFLKGISNDDLTIKFLEILDAISSDNFKWERIKRAPLSMKKWESLIGKSSKSKKKDDADTKQKKVSKSKKKDGADTKKKDDADTKKKKVSKSKKKDNNIPQQIYNYLKTGKLDNKREYSIGFLDEFNSDAFFENTESVGVAKQLFSIKKLIEKFKKTFKKDPFKMYLSDVPTKLSEYDEFKTKMNDTKKSQTTLNDESAKDLFKKWVIFKNVQGKDGKEISRSNKDSIEQKVKGLIAKDRKFSEGYSAKTISSLIQKLFIAEILYKTIYKVSPFEKYKSEIESANFISDWEKILRQIESDTNEKEELLPDTIKDSTKDKKKEELLPAKIQTELPAMKDNLSKWFYDEIQNYSKTPNTKKSEKEREILTSLVPFIHARDSFFDGVMLTESKLELIRLIESTMKEMESILNEKQRLLSKEIEIVGSFLVKIFKASDANLIDWKKMISPPNKLKSWEKYILDEPLDDAPISKVHEFDEDLFLRFHRWVKDVSKDTINEFMSNINKTFGKELLLNNPFFDHLVSTKTKIAEFEKQKIGQIIHHILLAKFHKKIDWKKMETRIPRKLHEWSNYIFNDRSSIDVNPDPNFSKIFYDYMVEYEKVVSKIEDPSKIDDNVELKELLDDILIKCENEYDKKNDFFKEYLGEGVHNAIRKTIKSFTILTEDESNPQIETESESQDETLQEVMRKDVLILSSHNKTKNIDWENINGPLPTLKSWFEYVIEDESEEVDAPNFPKVFYDYMVEYEKVVSKIEDPSKIDDNAELKELLDVILIKCDIEYDKKNDFFKEYLGEGVHNAIRKTIESLMLLTEDESDPQTEYDNLKSEMRKDVLTLSIHNKTKNIDWENINGPLPTLKSWFEYVIENESEEVDDIDLPLVFYTHMMEYKNIKDTFTDEFNDAFKDESGKKIDVRTYQTKEMKDVLTKILKICIIQWGVKNEFFDGYLPDIKEELQQTLRDIKLLLQEKDSRKTKSNQKRFEKKMTDAVKKIFNFNKIGAIDWDKVPSETPPQTLNEWFNFVIESDNTEEPDDKDSTDDTSEEPTIELVFGILNDTEFLNSIGFYVDKLKNIDITLFKIPEFENAASKKKIKTAYNKIAKWTKWILFI